MKFWYDGGYLKESGIPAKFLKNHLKLKSRITQSYAPFEIWNSTELFCPSINSTEYTEFSQIQKAAE